MFAATLQPVAAFDRSRTPDQAASKTLYAQTPTKAPTETPALSSETHHCTLECHFLHSTKGFTAGNPWSTIAPFGAATRTPQGNDSRAPAKSVFTVEGKLFDSEATENPFKFAKTNDDPINDKPILFPSKELLDSGLTGDSAARASPISAPLPKLEKVKYDSIAKGQRFDTSELRKSIRTKQIESVIEYLECLYSSTADLITFGHLFVDIDFNDAILKNLTLKKEKSATRAAMLEDLTVWNKWVNMCSLSTPSSERRLVSPEAVFGSTLAHYRTVNVHSQPGTVAFAQSYRSNNYLETRRRMWWLECYMKVAAGVGGNVLDGWKGVRARVLAMSQAIEDWPRKSDIGSCDALLKRRYWALKSRRLSLETKVIDSRGRPIQIRLPGAPQDTPILSWEPLFQPQSKISCLWYQPMGDFVDLINHSPLATIPQDLDHTRVIRRHFEGDFEPAIRFRYDEADLVITGLVSIADLRKGEYAALPKTSPTALAILANLHRRQDTSETLQLRPNENAHAVAIELLRETTAPQWQEALSLHVRTSHEKSHHLVKEQAGATKIADTSEEEEEEEEETLPFQAMSRVEWALRRLQDEEHDWELHDALNAMIIEFQLQGYDWTTRHPLHELFVETKKVVNAIYSSENNTCGVTGPQKNIEIATETAAFDFLASKRWARNGRYHSESRPLPSHATFLACRFCSSSGFLAASVSEGLAVIGHASLMEVPRAAQEPPALVATPTDDGKANDNPEAEELRAELEKLQEEFKQLQVSHTVLSEQLSKAASNTSPRASRDLSKPSRAKQSTESQQKSLTQRRLERSRAVDTATRTSQDDSEEEPVVVTTTSDLKTASPGGD